MCVQMDMATLHAVASAFPNLTTADLTGCARLGMEESVQLLKKHCRHLESIKLAWLRDGKGQIRSDGPMLVFEK